MLTARLQQIENRVYGTNNARNRFNEDLVTIQPDIESQEALDMRSSSPGWAVQNHKYESGQELTTYKKKNASYFKNSE